MANRFGDAENCGANLTPLGFGRTPKFHHVDDHGSKYARYVGRVGTLAVALGIGAATTFGSVPVARADDGASGSSASAVGGDSTTSNDGAGGGTDQGSGAKGDDGAPDSSAKDSSGAASTGDADADPVEAEPGSGDAQDPDADEVEQGPKGTKTPEPEPASLPDEPSAKPDHGSRPDPKPAATSRSVNGRSAPKAKVSEPAVRPKSVDSVDPKVSGGSAPAASSSGRKDSVSADAVSVSLPKASSKSELAPTPIAPQGPPKPAARAAAEFLNSLISAVFAPFASSGKGGLPAESPLLLALLAFARKGLGGDDTAVAEVQTTSLSLDDSSAETAAAPTARIASFAALDVVTGNPVTAVNDSITTPEDTPATGNLLTNDIAANPDGPSEVLTVSSAGTVTTTAGGSAVIASNGDYTYTPKANYNGADSFNYTVTDGSSSATGTVSVAVTPVNDAPVAVNDAKSLSEDYVRTFAPTELLANDTDADKPYGDTITLDSVAGAVNGTVVLNADGTITFAPAANYDGAASFTYKVKDSTGALSNSATVNLTITPVNDAPVAVNDSASVAEDTARTFTAIELVGNDNDPDVVYGDVLSVNSVAGATHGAVVLNADGTVTFTPAADYNGAASFTYKVKDSTGTVSANAATVNLTITPVNDVPVAVNDSKSVQEDFTRVFTTADLLSNDTDADKAYGDTLSFNSVSGATNSTVVLNADGTVTFTPAPNYNGVASFVYTAKDSAGAVSNGATVSVTVTAVNDAPVAVNDTVTVTEDTAKTFTAADLVGNDTDPDLVYGDTLRVHSVSGATNGTAVLNADGTVTFTPTANYNGPASFTYKVKDSIGTVSTNSATVAITVVGVNDAPTAVNDAGGTTAEDTPKTFTVASLVGNDTDADLVYGDVLSVHSVSGATNGTVVLNADGTVTFTPAADYNGTASFAYKVKDAAGVASANSATVTLSVTAVNDAPKAVNDSGTVVEDTAKTFTASDLLANDTDAEGDALSVSSVAGATNGTAVLNADGSVTFTPFANYNGAAVFTYKVKDANGAVSTNSGTVNLTVTGVNDAPTAVNDAKTVAEDTVRTFAPIELTANDTDPDKVYGDVLSVNSVAAATNGTVVLNADGTVTFTPTANFNGTASFTYTVKDTAGAVGATAATVTLTVYAVNDLPTAVDDAGGTTVEDTAKTFTAASLVGNDTDPDLVYGDTLKVHSVTGASNGTAVLNADGTVTFTPTANYNGAASFTYKVKDSTGSASANSATVTLTVSAVNDAPTAVNDTSIMPEDYSRTFSSAELTNNDTDPDKVYGDKLKVQSVSGATNGTAVLNADGTVTFTPTANFNGVASFTYKVKDTAGAVSANSATMSVTVTDINDAPTAVNDTGTVTEDTAKTFTAANLLGNDTDPDLVYGDSLSVQSVSGATHGSVVLNADGSVTFTPAADYNGAAGFTYTVQDSEGAVSANSGTVSLTVTGVNDAPTAVNDTGTVTEDTPKIFTAANLVGNDTDADLVYGDVLSVQSVSGATNGTVVLNADGTVTFTPTANYNGSASFTYVVKDSAGAVGASPATVTLTVAAVNDVPVAVNDAGGTVVEDTAKTFTAADLLGNDTDPDLVYGDSLSVASVAGAANGTVVLNADGTVTFTPTANYNGAAGFTYQVKDSTGAVSANSGTVSLTVTGVNDVPTAVNDSSTTAEDTAKTFTAANLVGNDVDPDKVYGDVLSVASVSGATNGTAVLNADGTVTFTPTANFNGTGTFTYKVKDSTGTVSANSATVSITVTAVNDAPTAVNDTKTVLEDNTRVFTAGDLLSNDIDPDKVYGDVLSFHSVTGATNGTAVLNADNTITFVPNANFNGTASFTYKVKDAAGVASANSATVTVTITPINDAPVAVNDTVTIPGGTAHTFTAADLVGNDTDVDGDALVVHTVSAPTHGTVVLNADGTVTFTPTASYTGPASFNYKVKDPAGAISLNTATVNITVTGVNTPPTAVNDTASTAEDTAKVFAAGSLTANDTDPESGSAGLSVAAVSGATHGAVVLNADGSVTFTPEADYNGAASFTHTAKDPAGAVSANSATVSITVTAVNDAPTAVNDTGTVTEDTAKVFTAANLVGNDTDADLVYGDVLSVNSVSGASNGSVVLNADGTVTFTPAADYNGAASFTYTVKDSAGAVSANTGTVTLTVAGVNDAPTAVNDTAAATEDTAKVFTAANLVGNDTDADLAYGDSLSVQSVSGATNGTVVLNADGTVTFTPAADYNGVASFTYKVKDAAGVASANSATVTITVAGVNDAPSAVGDTGTVTEDTAKVFTAANLVGNDTDADLPYGDVLSVQSVSGAANGTVVLNADGTVTFTPAANYNGAASFTYKVKDAAGVTSANSATVTLTVTGVNDAPTAVNDTGTTMEDTAKTFTAANLVGNDTDPDLTYGDTLSVASVAGATNGTVVLNADGTVTFTPTADYSGTASFTYKVKDSTGAVSANSATVTVSITPGEDDPPTAVNDTGIVTEDTAKVFTAASLVGNDTDADLPYGDTLSVHSVAGATNGTVVLNGDGTVTFTPTANYNGAASFTYKVKDSAGAVSTNSATVSLTVTAVNDTPTAVNDTGTVTEDTAKVFTAANLVGNDTDPDLVYGDSLSVQSVSGATNGSVVLNADGSVTFTPAADYNGTASFTYKVKDAAGAVSANSGTVSLTVTGVNDAPTAVNDTGTVTEDVAKVFTAANLVGNDTDADLAYGDTLSVQSVAGATNGSVVLNADGTVTFTPTANYNGAASFTYKVKDAAGVASANSATVTLTVTAVNDAPTAVNDSATVTEDTAKVFTAANLVGNDTDPDLVYGDVLSVQSVAGATNGTVVLNGDGTVTFTPTANYNGAASFTYKVKDAAGVASANSATVTMTVTAVNDAPTAVNDAATTTEDTAKTFTASDLVGNDTDPDLGYGDALSVQSVSGATNGTAVLNGDGTVTFTPTANFNGAASFTYKVKDIAGVASANSATVTVTVVGVNDVPVAVNDSGTVTEDTVKVFTAANLVGNDTDADIAYGDVLSVQSVAGATNGSVVLNADGSVTFTPAADYNGAASFTYKVKDSAGAVSANSGTVSLTVTGVNDAPTAVNDTGTVTEDTPKIFTAANLVGNDTDADLAYGDVLSVQSVSGAANGTVVLNADGTVTFTPAADFNGAASFTYKVKDAAGAVSANTGTVSLTVTGVNDAPTAVGDSGSTAEDTAKTFTAADLTGNDIDPDRPYGDVLSVQSVSGATNGTVVLNGDGTVTFTPTANFNGAASFTYKVKDTAGVVSTNSATVNLTVTAVNDAPVAVNDTFTIPGNAPRNFTATELTGNDTDVDGDTPLSVQSVSGATNGAVVLNGDGTVTFTPTTGYSGAASFTYKVKDPAGAASANSATVNITVSPVVNHQPTAVNDTATTVEDTQKVFAVGSLTGNDTDPDAGQTLSVNSVAGATNGNVVLNADGTVTFTPTTDFNGTATFTYNVKDNLGAVSANSATVSITVTGVPDAPTAVNDSASTAEDTAKVFTAADLTGNDIDPDKVYGDVLSVNSVFGATNGTAVLNANGTVTFTPTADFNGTGSFTYTVKDAAGNVSANNAVVSINVTAVNDAPTAVNDTANVTSGVARTFTAAELVGNDTDPDILYGDTLSVQSITGATNGTAVLNANGTVTFTSTANYSGPASFSYKVKDAAGAVSAASATVNITVTLSDPILARDDTLSTNEDTAAAGNVLTNDIAQNPDGPSEPLTVTTTGTINTTAGGTVTMAANGDYTYYPATDFNGTDTFTYTVTDGTLPDVGTVTITVAADDDATENPIYAQNDVNNTNINTPVSGNVLSNDIANNPDGPGEPLWVITTGTSVNSYGSLVLNKNGAYVYTPVAGFTGDNQFSYVVTDGNSWSTGYLTITVVNTNPIVARDDSFTVNQAASNALIGNVLTNDRAQNPDGTAEPITVDPNYTSTTAQGGTVTVYTDGTLYYTPPSAGFTGTDTFDYTVSDHAYLSGSYWWDVSTTDVGTVTITVTVNHPTVAVDDTVTTAKNAPVSGNVLTNDNAQNPDANIPVNYTGAGETLTLTQMDSYTAQGGYVSWNTYQGDYTYTPPTDFTGADSFTYTVTDGTTTDVGTVNISVVDVNTHAVVAVNDVNTDLQSGSFHAVTGNVLTNDKAQNPDGPLERLTVVDNTQSVAGNTVYVDGNGYYTYYVPADFSGTDTFTYTVSDGTSTAVGTVTITVDVNDPVVARPDSLTLAEDTWPSGYTGNVLTNDIAQNPDGPNEYLYVSAYDQTSAAGASVGVYGDGSYYYYPVSNFHGTDTFTYTVTDGTTSSVGTVTVTVTPVPDPVAAVVDSYDANKTTPITGNVLTNDIAQNPDGPGEPLSVIGTGHITSWQGGSVVINSDGAFTYTAQTGFVGNDYFYYSVTDGTSVSQNYVSIIVRDVVGRADNYTTAEDTPLTGNVLTNDIAQNPDGPGEVLTVYAPGNVNTYHGGTAVIAADGSFTYTPPADYNGTDTFNYTVTDLASYDSTTVTVNVTPVPDALQLALTPMTAAGSGAQVTYTVSVVHPDPNETVTFSVTTQPTKGTVSQGGNAFYYNPDPAAFNYTPGATDSFVVTADDGNGDVKTQLVTYTYAPVTSLTLADYSYDISASDDGTRTYVLLQGSNQVQIVNTGGSTPTNIGVVNVEAGSTAIAASANGTRAFVANYNANTVSMIDTSGATPTVRSIPIGATPVSVAVSANGTRAFTVNTDSTVSIINASGGTPTVTSVNVGSNPTDVAVSADGTRAFVTNRNSGTVSIINTSGASPTVTDVTLDYSPNAVKVSDNGAVAIVNSYYGDRVTIVKYNGTTATTTTLALPVSSYLSDCIAISDDGTRAFITSQSNAKYALGVIDTTVASPTVTWFAADAPMYHVVSSSDGSHAYAIGNGAGVYLFDTATGEYTLLKGTAWGYYYQQVAVSDNGLRVVSTDGSNLTLAVLPASLL